MLVDEAAQRFALGPIIVRNLDDFLRDVGGGGGGPRNFHAHGIVQELLGQALDFRRHGGRIKKRLPREGDQLADAFDIGNEAHVEHAVGFVDHQNLNLRKHQLAALEMIEQAARRRDQHIHAAIELAVLFVERGAADQKRHRELVVLAVFLEILGDLRRQFARRLQNQRARHARLGPAARQHLDHRQGEGGGLARARLRDADHVAALQHMGNALRLNGGGGGVAAFGHGLQHLGRKAKRIEPRNFEGGWGGRRRVAGRIDRGFFSASLRAGGRHAVRHTLLIGRMASALSAARMAAESLMHCNIG